MRYAGVGTSRQAESDVNEKRVNILFYFEKILKGRVRCTEAEITWGVRQSKHAGEM